MTIRNWPEAERPREKLLRAGPNCLSDAELLAIFLRTGCAGRSAVDLARDLLKRFGSLRRMLESNQTQFCEAKGLGVAKYAQLQATLEMSRRHLAETLSVDQALNSSAAVKQFVTAQLRHEHSEVFSVLYLNSQHQLLGFEALFRGSVDNASVYPREVVKAALKHNCSAMILAHNHPSGVTEPSQADRHITRRLQQALELIDVRVLDHIVVGEGEPFSFAEHGLI